jgi:hypothetical protein
MVKARPKTGSAPIAGRHILRRPAQSPPEPRQRLILRQQIELA